MTPLPGREASFLYLNVDRRWDGFHVRGLDIGGDGALRLRSLPRLRAEPPEGIREAPAPDAPAGVAAAPDGSVYFTGVGSGDRAGDGAGGGDAPARVLRVDRCDGTMAGVPCVGGSGSDPVQLRDPRGLLVQERWGQLLVADAGNGRIQRFELATSQLVGIWGADDGLVEPWALAPDGAGGVLVVDVGAGAVVAFDATGRRVPGPWAEMVAGSVAPARPIGIATAGNEDATTIYLLDREGPWVLAFDAEGRQTHAFGNDVLRDPLAIAATAGAVYVGDNGLRRIVVFRPDGEHVGELDGYRGPVAALTIGADGDLLVHPGVPFSPLACAPAGAFSRSGWAWGGAFSNPGQLAREWHLISALGDIPAGAHLQLFVYASPPEGPGPTDGPSPPWSDATTDLAATFADDGLADGHWIAVPVDASAAVVHALKRPPDDGLPAVGAAAAATRLTRLWVGLSLTSDGTATASVEQLRVDFDVATGLEHLPAIYSQERASSRFLDRYLALSGTAFADVERRIDALPARFDPVAAPPDALTALARWIALDVDGEWSESELRAAIGGAFEAYARRGTVAGLREQVRLYARADVHIEEPLANAGWWLLGGDADCDDGRPGPADEEPLGGPILGFTTMLAAVEPQGAVLGTTAVVDGSQLLAGDEEGTGLFSNIADRFTALVYQGARHSPERLAEIRAVIDREKPAGTVYDLCVVEPSLRVGYQARVGIDTVVSGDAQPSRLGEAAVSGLVLGGELPAAIGDGIKVGRSTRLAEGS